MEVKRYILFLFIPLFLLQPLAAAIESTPVCTTYEWTDLSADENSEAVLVTCQRLSTRIQLWLPGFLEVTPLSFRTVKCYQSFKDHCLRPSELHLQMLYCVYQE